MFVHNYHRIKFINTKAIKKKDRTIVQKIQRLKYKYLKKGLLKYLKIIVLTLINKHIHVITIKKNSQGWDLLDVKNVIDSRIFAKNLDFNDESPLNYYNRLSFKIIGYYWRPYFENRFFPYILPHIKYYKEIQVITLLSTLESLTIKVYKMI
mmetsp:Transcript_916/g.1355  ORF Transcript_916/g.1355 Transcript_916/m.1355 type:complete len:152 (+) Transcript_916:1940-2395(+)